MTIRLYDYWRSSACYRVRIALNLKVLAYEAIDTSLIDGAHRTPEFLARNPQGFVPMLEVGDVRLVQSLAIIDWLDATYPEPRLVPSDPTQRAHAMAAALVVAADIHPLNNLRIIKYLANELGIEEGVRDDWYRHWVTQGFIALEAMAAGDRPFFGGDAPNIADVCLVPQMFNARRFNTPLEAFPNLVRIDAACAALEPFQAAHPDAVKAN